MSASASYETRSALFVSLVEATPVSPEDYFRLVRRWCACSSPVGDASLSLAQRLLLACADATALYPPIKADAGMPAPRGSWRYTASGQGAGRAIFPPKAYSFLGPYINSRGDAQRHSSTATSEALAGFALENDCGEFEGVEAALLQVRNCYVLLH